MYAFIRIYPSSIWWMRSIPIASSTVALFRCGARRVLRWKRRTWLIWPWIPSGSVSHPSSTSSYVKKMRAVFLISCEPARISAGRWSVVSWDTTGGS